MTRETPYRYCPRCGAELVVRLLDGDDRERRACRNAACGFVHYDNPTPVVAVLPTLGDHAVLARNVTWPAKMFSLITGFLEAGEDPAECAARELQEELGLAARRLTLIGLYPFRPFNQLLICYHAEAEGELRLGAEIAETRTIPLDRLRAWDVGPGLAVRDWLARRG